MFFFGFFAHLFVCFSFCVPWCLSSPYLLVHLAIHWWLFVTQYHFVVHQHLLLISPCWTCCSLDELFISPIVIHHHLTIRHCLALFIVTLGFSSLPCVAYHCFVCHHHCIVIAMINPLFVLPSINTTSTSQLIVAHCHIAICFTPLYCGDDIFPLLSMCKLLIVCALWRFQQRQPFHF